MKFMETEFEMLSEVSALKSQLMSFWKDIFHDDDKYIELFFEYYFDKCYKRILLDGRDIVATLYGIPYTFRTDSSRLNGIYLCGLATSNVYRKRGIMSKLIREFISDIEFDQVCDFVFLIPADNHLREYYKSFGFEDSSDIYRMYLSPYSDTWRIILSSAIENYISSDKGYYRADIYDIEHSIFSDFSVLSRVINRCIEAEYDNIRGIRICHRYNDWCAILRDIELSGSQLLVVYDKDNQVDIVVSIDSEGELKILCGNLKKVEYVICGIFKKFRDLSCDLSDDEVCLIIQKIKYGMVKFLSKSQASENRIFQTNLPRINKYKKIDFVNLICNSFESRSNQVNFQFMLD
ncbi:GNAT family N-acetyltransferase [Bacteroides acidifaciens]|nr:GNAT family N-acetyltransferase [Bacteroides acidifaciens]